MNENSRDIQAMVPKMNLNFDIGTRVELTLTQLIPPTSGMKRNKTKKERERKKNDKKKLLSKSQRVCQSFCSNFFLPKKNIMCSGLEYAKNDLTMQTKFFHGIKSFFFRTHICAIQTLYQGSRRKFFVSKRWNFHFGRAVAFFLFNVRLESKAQNVPSLEETNCFIILSLSLAICRQKIVSAPLNIISYFPHRSSRIMNLFYFVNSKNLLKLVVTRT